MKGFGNLSLLLAFLSFFFLAGCGSRQLQSLTVSPASTTAQGGQAQFTATGQFNMSPMTMTPASVDWFSSLPACDPPGGNIPLTLTSQPFTAQCLQPGIMTVTAVAPMDTSAGANVSVPLKVFVDLVLSHTTTQEGGFVAATAQLTCP